MVTSALRLRPGGPRPPDMCSWARGWPRSLGGDHGAARPPSARQEWGTISATVGEGAGARESLTSWQDACPRCWGHLLGSEGVLHQGIWSRPLAVGPQGHVWPWPVGLSSAGAPPGAVPQRVTDISAAATFNVWSTRCRPARFSARPLASAAPLSPPLGTVLVPSHCSAASHPEDGRGAVRTQKGNSGKCFDLLAPLSSASHRKGPL